MPKSIPYAHILINIYYSNPLLHLLPFYAILLQETPMTRSEPNQAIRFAISSLYTAIFVSRLVLIIGVGVTGPA